jgi:glycosyl hydrolase family 99/fibronectin type III domain protein
MRCVRTSIGTAIAICVGIYAGEAQASNPVAPQGVAAQSAPTTAVSADVQPTLPVRAAFYYPWFPEAWKQQGLNPFTAYHPSLGLYSSSTAGVIRRHVRAMAYAGIGVGIASWAGRGTQTDGRVPLLLSNTAAIGSGVRWSLYYEAEGSTDPSVTAIAADLAYIRDHYAADPSYFRIGGRFVVFAYGGATDDCAMVSRWKQANAGIGAYLVLKVYKGYATCAEQPDALHQYAPAGAITSRAGQWASISPGFYKPSESAPRLTRDLTAWYQNVRALIASKAPFQLVTTFNEWGEGTGVESADEWSTSSGYGAYLDALRANGQSPAPGTPNGLTGTHGNATASLSWRPGAEPDLAGYRIYRRAYDAAWPTAPVATVTTSSWQDSGLTNGASYAYRVSAYNTAGHESAPSPAVTVRPVGPRPADPVIAAAGDVACAPNTTPTSISCKSAATSDLLLGLQPTALLSLGDHQYECGSLSAFMASYDPTWGRLKSITHPAVGNHEYLTTGGADCAANVKPDGSPSAAGYFDYFDGAGNQDGPAGARDKGYYSYDIGAWHLIALNANCSRARGCSAGSPQEAWLRADLAAHPNACTLAYWHQPRFSSGEHGSSALYDAFWSDLYAAGAEIVLNGHDHDYERFAPQSPAQVADPAGIREFVVGTGGRGLRPVAAAIANSEVINTGTFGVLELTLHATSYDWHFAPVAGNAFSDAGSQACH